jgi:hypothetical protein
MILLEKRIVYCTYSPYVGGRVSHPQSEGVPCPGDKIEAYYTKIPNDGTRQVTGQSFSLHGHEIPTKDLHSVTVERLTSPLFSQKVSCPILGPEAVYLNKIFISFLSPFRKMLR